MFSSIVAVQKQAAVHMFLEKHAHVPAEACTKLKGARVGNKDPVLRLSGIHVLTAASAIDVQTKRRADFLFFLPCCKPLLLQLK